MTLATAALGALAFLLALLKVWLNVFLVSFTNLSTLWIIVPIWLSWFFAEFFQEKEGTSFGNAISNGVIPFWVGIDWIRQITNQLLAPGGKLTLLVFGKYAISALAMIYGLAIIIYGIKGRAFVRYVGRIREVTYFLAMVTPFVYGLIAPSVNYVLAVIVFFPVFYFVIEIIDRVAPKPHAYAADALGKTQTPTPSFSSFKLPPPPTF